jgi:hypothetical protein
MGLLKTGACFTQELKLPANKVEIAKTFVDCAGSAHIPGDAIPSCNDMAAAINASHQAISIAGQTLSLSNGGGSVTLPDSDAQALSITGNVISLTNGGSVTLPTTAAPVPQVLSVAGNTISLSGGGGSVVSPDAQTLSLAGNVLTISNGNNVTLPAVSVPFATPAETVAGTSTALAVNPADLYARENIAAQTGLGLVLSAIPAPTAGQSPWGVNTLGETLHYAPGVGWKIVDNRYTKEVPILGATAPAGVWGQAAAITAPRAGLLLVNAFIAATTANAGSLATAIFVNGVQKTQTQMDSWGTLGQSSASANIYGCTIHDTPSYVIPVNAGDVITCGAVCSQYPSTLLGGFNRITYLN